MRKFVVINAFKDLEDEGHIYKPGQFYPREGSKLNEERADFLSSMDNPKKKAFLVEVKVNSETRKEAPPEEEKKHQQKPREEAFPKLLGGGFYELSNGEKVRGKEEAKKAEEALA